MHGLSVVGAGLVMGAITVIVVFKSSTTSTTSSAAKNNNSMSIEASTSTSTSGKNRKGTAEGVEMSKGMHVNMNGQAVTLTGGGTDKGTGWRRDRSLDGMSDRSISTAGGGGGDFAIDTVVEANGSGGGDGGGLLHSTRGLLSQLTGLEMLVQDKSNIRYSQLDDSSDSGSDREGDGGLADGNREGGQQSPRLYTYTSNVNMSDLEAFDYDSGEIDDIQHILDAMEEYEHEDEKGCAV